MVFICKLLKTGCKSFSLSHMVFLQSCSCQDDCSIYYACAVLGRNLSQRNMLWETPVIVVTLFPEVLENRSLHLMKKYDYLCQCVWNTTWSSSSLSMSMISCWLLESYLLMLVYWQKGISPSNFLCNETFSVISTSEWLHTSLKQQVVKRIFGLLGLAKIVLCLGLLISVT